MQPSRADGAVHPKSYPGVNQVVGLLVVGLLVVTRVELCGPTTQQLNNQQPIKVDVVFSAKPLVIPAMEGAASSAPQHGGGHDDDRRVAPQRRPDPCTEVDGCGADGAAPSIAGCQRRSFLLAAWCVTCRPTKRATSSAFRHQLQPGLSANSS